MGSHRRTEIARRGEDLALAHLQRLGFWLVARNHRTRRGELDLIVCDGRTLVFAEVKTRCRGPGRPFDALGPAKQLQVRRRACDWLAQVPHPRVPELRFDAVGVTLDDHGGLLALEHLEGAF